MSSTPSIPQPTIPQPRRSILEINAYVPGASGEGSGGTVHKLSSNESPLGPSPQAIAAFRSAAEHLEAYPDGSAHALRAAIGAKYGLDPARIVCANGSDELISLICTAYLNPSDETVYSQHGFLMYRISTLAAGGRPVAAPETDYTADVDAMLAAVTDRTRVVFLANPNNPTGTYLPFDAVRRLHAGLRSDTLLVIDAAYAEYVRRNDYEAGIELVATAQHVVMTRTFSKIYGLAGLRLGWAYCPEPVADSLNRVRGPFNVNAPAIAAGVAAINDSAQVEASVVHNDTWLPWLAGEFAAIGIETVPSVGNFLLLRFPDAEGKRAADANAFLQERGVFIRAVGGYGLPDCLRMTVGTEEANRLTVAALTEFMNR